MLSSVSIQLQNKEAYIVWITALTVYGATAILTEPPQNMALVMGYSGFLNCTSSEALSRHIQWYKGTGTSNTIAVCRNGSIAQLGYSWEATTLYSCNLIIQNATAEQAGLYQCKEAVTVEPPAYAQLIVLETIPECRTQPTDTVNISDTVMMTCSARYFGSLAPVMKWYNVTGDEIGGDNIGSDEHLDYKINVSPRIPIVPEYMCNTSFNTVPPFEPPTTDGSTASNTPSYTSLCYTKPLSVQYPPYAENITITPNTTEDLPVGDVLTCSAVANPPVTSYQWSNGSAVLVNGSTLTLDQIGDNVTYTCTATNLLGSNSTEIVINVIPLPVTITPHPGRETTRSTSSGSQQLTTQDWTSEVDDPSTNIGTIVGGVIGSLAAVIVAIVIIILCRRVDSCPLHKKLSDDTPGSSDDDFERIISSPKEPRAMYNDGFDVTDILYVELQPDHRLINRRITNPAAAIPYYDEYDKVIPHKDEENVPYSNVTVD